MQEQEAREQENELARHSIPCVKMEKEEYRDVHDGLARDTRMDPIDVETPSPSPPRKRACLPSQSVANPDTLAGMEGDLSSPVFSDHMPAVGDQLDYDMDVYSENGGATEKGHFKDVCLVLSLQKLGCPTPCVADGPFCAADGCHMLAPLASLRLMQKSSPMRSGKYVALNVHEKHFFAVQHVDGFVSVHNHWVFICHALSFLTHISTSADFHVFKLVLRSQEDEEYAHCA